MALNTCKRPKSIFTPKKPPTYYFGPNLQEKKVPQQQTQVGKTYANLNKIFFPSCHHQNW